MFIRKEVTMSELVPDGLPRGSDIVKEGMDIGQTFEVGKSAFMRYRKVRRESDWKRIQARKGHIQWNPIVGLATLDEQVEAVKRLWEWGLERGIEIDRCLHISNMLNGLPPELREKAPKPTSFLLESPEDFIRIAEAAPIQPVFDDHMVGNPNSVNNAVNCLKAGCNDVGTLCQYVWDYPYYHDDVGQVVETVKALGVLAAKRKDGAFILTYVGDGIPGQLIDHVSEVGYVRLEKYIADELCGTAYAASLGGVHSYIPAKLATWLALGDILEEEDFSVLTFYQGNTLEPTEDLEANYGLVVSDFLPFALLERRNKTGVAYMPNPVTECVRVPTIKEIIDALSACAVSLNKALELEEGRLIDDTYVNEMRAMLVDKGEQFFRNALKGLAEMGVDTRDPVQMLLALRRLGGRRIEELFHPGEKDPSVPRGFVPFLPTDLLKKPMAVMDVVLEQVKSEGLADVGRNKAVVMGSTDTHEYGLFVVGGILNAVGAKAIDCGLDLDPEQLLDFAHEAGTPYVAVSTHNGQCLDWGVRLVEEAKKRGQEVKVFMGGKLNAIVDGASEPIDVCDRLGGIGITPCVDVIDFIRGLSEG
jgi:methylmalonyl-CoA mutase cobalamin-binding subunit